MTDILLAGQAVLDFIFDLDDLPTRAEKYRAKQGQIIGGGCAANAAVAVARLGGTAHLAARVGADQIGGLIVGGLRADGVNTDNVALVPGGRSSYSAINIDAAGERQIVNLRGEGLGEPLDWTHPTPRAVLADTRWHAGALHALTLARALGIPGVLDGEAPISQDLAEAASHVAFSVQGICDFTGETDKIAALKEADRRLPGWVAVTDGADGVYFLDHGVVRHIPSFTVEVVDTLGAGDVWHGAFTLALAEEMNVEDAILFASATAALKCTKLGGRAGTPDRATVIAFLKENT
ncbi:sulfofructose kinase [Rubricella aquisinus]|uniref:Sulfofructose kinase n=1 Tax=Rubricella aquisinus TaxID=2028108 RepID=A0A840X019_9RHOB|nr:PfkB family carbohydrate kinase [Rubricella aquisinus]MBB5515246.1 sulfofructose kinase [Rubricella aquisinus]